MAIGQAAAGAALPGQGGGFFHGGFVAADDQLSRAVVVGDHHAAQVRGLLAGRAQGVAVQIQNSHHGAVPSGGSFLHGPAPEGHQLHGGRGVQSAGGVKGGVFAQGQARGGCGDNAPFRQHGGHAGGKGHHAGLGIAGLVQDPVRVLKADLLQIKVHLSGCLVKDGAKGGKGFVQVRTHAWVLAALAGIQETELHCAALHSFMIWSICAGTVERDVISPAPAPQKNRPFSKSPFRAAMRAREIQ